MCNLLGTDSIRVRWEDSRLLGAAQMNRGVLYLTVAAEASLVVSLYSEFCSSRVRALMRFHTRTVHPPLDDGQEGLDLQPHLRGGERAPRARCAGS